MSNVTNANTSSISDASVAEYLSNNPDFFADKNELLADMLIPHARGEAISLVERQVQLLRDRIAEHETNISSIITNAKANDELFGKIRAIILDLLETSSIKQLSSLVEQQLKDNFAASISKLIFVADPAHEIDQQQDFDGYTILSKDLVKNALGELFDQRGSFCGSLVPRQMGLLFPEIDLGIVSAAIIPIHLNQDANSKLPGTPLLAIGSNKENHFHSNLDTLFLDFIGEILAVHISRIS